MANNTIRNPEKYEYAYLLYMQKYIGKDICEKVGVTPATLQKWKENNGWESRRAARTISVDELINKTLLKINSTLENPDFNASAFSKAVAQLKHLKNSTTVDDQINTLTNFGDWLIFRMSTDKKITGDFVKQITSLQDVYILERLRNGTKSQ